MQRLLAPSLREQSNALNVARIALSGLDDMISGSRRIQTRHHRLLPALSYLHIHLMQYRQG